MSNFATSASPEPYAGRIIDVDAHETVPVPEMENELTKMVAFTDACCCDFENLNHNVAHFRRRGEIFFSVIEILFSNDGRFLTF